MSDDAAVPQARFREGLALHREGRLAAAQRIYREILERQPDHFGATHMLGVAALQEHRSGEGAALIRKAIALDDGVAAAHNNLGKALLAQGRPEEALDCFDRAIALAADFIEAYIHRGAVLMSQQRVTEALESYQKAVALKPENAELHRNCGHILARLGRHDDAFAAYDNAFRLDPDMTAIEGYRLYARMHLCDWENLDSERADLVASVRDGKPSAQPFIFLAVPSSSADQRRCAHAWARRHFPGAGRPLWNGEKYRHDRIRLAYLSADFRQHAAAVLMAGMFECHDKSRFELTAISWGADDGSGLRQRIAGAFDRFVDARTSGDDEIAGLLHALEIDIAVDLMGFTTDSRTGILARRPAPVQAHYMGFPGTMAVPYLDYIVADRVVIPKAARAFYSEKVVSLPNSYFVNDDKREIADRIFTRAELGLPATGFVFCCFNSSHKITPEVFEVWMRILKAVEGSVLWLYQEDARAAENLRHEARAWGVDPERLVFAQRVPPAEHLARHRAADLLLDTLPYNAHTTAADALWAGLPVLTCRGETFAGRVAASLLEAIGLPELIARTPGDYERLAVGFARNAARFDAIKAKLAKNRATAPLFDTQLFTHHIEAAYVEMHRRHQQGLPPDHIEILA